MYRSTVFLDLFTADRVPACEWCACTVERVYACCQLRPIGSGACGTLIGWLLGHGAQPPRTGRGAGRKALPRVCVKGTGMLAKSVPTHWLTVLCVRLACRATQV